MSGHLSSSSMLCLVCKGLQIKSNITKYPGITVVYGKSYLDSIQSVNIANDQSGIPMMSQDHWIRNNGEALKQLT